jgi:L-ribulose-5-phosphate 4-epimerase
MYGAERTAIVDAARLLIDRHALSLSLHGNISVRVPGTDHLVITGSSLTGLTESSMAVLSLDGEIIEGRMAPAEREVLGMHTGFYAERPDAAALIHTHSPYATAFAVANTELPVVAESLARWGIENGIPVARWAPRGSEDSIAFIADALRRHDDAESVLLGNHGLLVSGGDLNAATRRTIAIEENAQLAILAAAIGGPHPLELAQARKAAARRQEYLARADRAG